MFPRGVVGRRARKRWYQPVPHSSNPQHHHAQSGLYPVPHPNNTHSQNGLYPRPPNPQRQPLSNNGSGRVEAPPPVQQYQWNQVVGGIATWFDPPPATPQDAAPPPEDNTAYAAKRRKRQNSDADQHHHHHHAPPPSKLQRVDTPPPLPPLPKDHHAPQQQQHAPPPSEQQQRADREDAVAGSSCQEDHHSSSSPPRPPRTPPTATQVPRSNSLLYPYASDKLSSQVLEVYEACHQQLPDLQKKEVFRTWLQADINRLFPEARLYLTGSSMSGLACRSSDADLCLVLDSWSPPPRGFLGFLHKALKQMRDLQRPDPISVLSALLKLFRTLPYLRETHLIRAKVPILRFIEAVSGVEFDLNVNNTVGIRNTFLLRTYGEADPRVKPLILVIKKWARHHQINDASKGTLSSYTLVLMVLSYLQILHKPVLPSLQRDFPESFHPSMEIDMVPHGPRNIPAYLSKNQSSLGDLLLGFLQHYATVFKWDKEVISVREARRLTKERSGAREFISVEEPFERNNVARAVHEKIKFDAIRAEFSESYQRLSQKRDLNSILPVRETINQELSGP